MVKMFPTCLDDTLERLSVVEKHPLISYDLTWYRNTKYVQVQLRALRMFLWCFPDCDANLLADFNFLATSITELYKLDPRTDSLAHTDTEFYSLSTEVREMLSNCHTRLIMEDEYRLRLISSCCSFKAEPSFTSKETIELLDYVHVLLNDVLKYKRDSPNLDGQIESLGEIMFLIRDLVYYTTMDGDQENTIVYLSDSSYTNPQLKLIFLFIIHRWANKAASFTLLYWLFGIKIKTIQGLLIHLKQKVNPCDPVFIKLCFQVIKVPKMKCEDRLLFGEFVSRFVDFFLDNLMLILNDHHFPMVREGLIFLITFLADPPANTLNHTDLMPFVRQQIYAVLDLASNTMCFFREANIDGKTILDAFLKSIAEVRGDIVNLFVHIPPSSRSDFPRINKLGHFECLLAYLENLKDTMNLDKKLVPFLKHQLFTIQEELLSLKDTRMMQNEHSGSKDIWDQIMSLLYQADFSIKSSFFIDDPIWYNLTCLSFLIKKIKDIRYKVMNVEFETQTEVSSISETKAIVDAVVPKTSTSNDEAVVGFEKETDLLTDRLKGGSEQLDIISIVGMGGIGKTTLAKKLYDEPSIKLHFHKSAFCSVSQVYNKRNVLLDILSDLSLNDGEIHQMDDDELAHLLRKSLLGSRYLIVIDDIWDIHVWNDLRAAFPDEPKRSRVIFTTRISKLSNSPCRLPFLTMDESWKLLQLKTFDKVPCPPHLLEVGKIIAKKCEGLPLSIVVIAGLLTRTERSLLKWKEVAHSLSSFASNEVCKAIIKLSYKHIKPEALKSCFLYLGALPKNGILEPRKLSWLWIAEGLVLKSGDSSLLKIAKKYLNDLSDRNLVTVTERSYNGGIKSWRVHDLIRDFCRIEAQEEHHLCYINAQNNNFPMSRVLSQHRISIEGEWRSFVNAKPRGSAVHSLLFLPRSRYSYSEDHCEMNLLKSLLSNFKLVQVLDLLDIILDGGFPTAVTTLVHLRYLALRFSAGLYVPPEIINLWNLETLIILASRMVISLDKDSTENSGAIRKVHFSETLHKVEFPLEIWKMKRLKHVELMADTFVAFDDVRGVISPLPDLISFGFLYIPKGEGGYELLRRLSNVREFRCICSGRWDPDREWNELPKLETLTKLESLYMGHNGEARPPYMFSFPSTIKKLILQNFGVRWNEFSDIIQKLPCLEVLDLQDNAFSGKIWNMEEKEDEQFPNIKFLKLDNLDIEEWNASVDSFRNLVKLDIYSCRKLIAIPPCFGEVVTLMSIDVISCKKSVADSAIQIQNDQIDSGNQSFRVYLL